MQWLIDLVIEYLRNNGLLLPAYIDRGDPAAFDFVKIDFTRDGAWHDLDLSSIVPAGAKAVNIRLEYNEFLASKHMQFRKNGNSNSKNVLIFKTSTVLGTRHNSGIVACDDDRIIEYKADASATWMTLNLTVLGWIL